MINVIYNNENYNATQFLKAKPQEYLKILQWGRKYPTRFIEKILEIQLTDHQKYILLSAWIARDVCIVASRSSGKSFLMAVYIMARCLLFPNYVVALMAPDGKQSKMLFQKIEDIATHKLESIKNRSNVFYNEVVKGPNSNGFHHDDRYWLELYNGSKIETFNSDPSKNVGYRCNLLIYDEAGKIPRNTFALMNPFVAVQSDFKTGNINTECYPESLSKQIVLISSAEDIDTQLFDNYKFNAKKMLEGDPDYFVIDLNCEMSLHPYMNGEPMNPLVTQELIDGEMAKNEVKALREWYNLFDHNNGEDSVVRRSSIERNYITYPPIFESRDSKELYVLCYDPAEKIDNSFVLVGRFFHDDEKGWMAEVVNGVNFLERLPDGTKKIIAKPQQVELFKKMMIDYNGTKFNVRDWENITVYIDPGAGGGGYTIATYLLDNWNDENGQKHFGIIDKSDKDLSLEAYKFPEAKNILHLPTASAQKVNMSAALTDMVEQNLIKFPRPLNVRQEFEYEEEDENGELICKYVKAQPEEIRAMTEIDLMITEVTSMQRVKTPNGNIQIKLPKNLERKMHDDRSYCLALLSWHLYQLRTEERLAKEREANAWKQKYKDNNSKKPQKNNNPFGYRNNPFVNMGENPFR